MTCWCGETASGYKKHTQRKVRTPACPGSLQAYRDAQNRYEQERRERGGLPKWIPGTSILMEEVDAL